MPGVGEIGIVGGDDRQAPLLGEVEQAALDRLLVGQPVPLQLHVETIAEAACEAIEKIGGGVALAVLQQPAERSGRTAGEQDQALGVGEQRLRTKPVAPRRRWSPVGRGLTSDNRLA